MNNRKTPILVLCHTIFHQSLRSSEFRDSKGNIGEVKKWLYSRFIFDFIIEIASEFTQGQYFACTSEKVFNDIRAKLGEKIQEQQVANYLEAMESVIFCVNNKKINELDIDKGIIVIADTLSNVGNYKPYIITDMKNKKYDKALAYYQKYTGEDEPKIPFGILTLEETIGFLQGGYSIQFDYAKQRAEMYKIL